MARVFNHLTSISLAALVLALPACGGGSDAASSGVPTTTATEGPTATATGTPPTASAPSAPTPPPDAPTPTPTPTAPGESQPGGGGDEEAARVPVDVTVGSDGTVAPQEVDVPAFFALELRVRNRTGGSITVRWTASEPSGTFEVGAGKTGSRRVAGVKAGRYPLAVTGAGTATVVAGAAPGP
jgi:septal ring-binding cell division protein DamX